MLCAVLLFHVAAAEPASQPASYQVEAVSVLGSPIEQAHIAGAAYAIDEKKLQTFGYTDVHRALGEAPGVYVRDEDGFGLRPNIGLRGANSDRSSKVALLEDGVLMAPAPYAAPAAYYFPMMGRITGVEVFKGPASIKYGPQTIGGAVNLLTRFVPRQLSVGADLMAGMYGTTNAHAYFGHGNELFGALVEAAYQHSDGFKQLESHKPTGFDRVEIMAKASANTPLTGEIAHQWDVKGSVAYELSNETYLGLSDADFAANPYQRYFASENDQMKSWRTQVQASYLLVAGEMWELSVKAYRHDQSRQWTKVNGIEGAPGLTYSFASPDSEQSQLYLAALKGEGDAATRVLIGTNDRRFVAQGIQATVTAHPVVGPVKQDIELGLRFHHDQIDRVHDEYAYVTTDKVLQRDSDRRIIANNLARALALSVYAQDQLQWKRLLIVPGLRFEYIRTNYDERMSGTTVTTVGDSVAVLPGIGVYYGLIDELGVLAGVHRGFSPRSPGQAGNVQPEYSINYEAGMRAKWRGLDAEAIAFVNDYQNLTGECTFSSGCLDAQVNTQFNGGAVLVYGVEASAKFRHTFAHDVELRTQASYTLTLSQFRTDFDSDNPLWGAVHRGDALPYVPVHQASVTLGVGMRDWGVDFTTKIVGEMRDVAGQGAIAANAKIPTSAYLDAAAFYALPGGVRIVTTLENISNTPYLVSRRPFGARPGKPITFLAGLRYNF